MKLSVEIWEVAETERRYLSEDLSLTSRNYPISWFKEKSPEHLELDEGEEDLAVGIFTVNSIKAATIWPNCVEVQVENPSQWSEVQPAILAILQSHAGVDEVTTYASPHNL